MEEVIIINVNKEEANFIMSAIIRRRNALQIALIEGECVISTTIEDKNLAKKAISCHDKFIQILEKHI